MHFNMIERYRALFINNPNAYAIQSQDGTEYWCVREPVTDQVIQQHLDGAETCGWYCLNEESKVKWGVVDIDEEEEGIFIAQDIHRRLAEIDVPAYIEESRNLRAHVWVITPSWPARPVRELLHAVVENENIEIFPKQDRVYGSSVGSLVRGPLGIHKKTYEWYGFLDPETLERIPDRHEYVQQMQPVDGYQLAGALNELLREQRIQQKAATEKVAYASLPDTLGVAQALNIPMDRKTNYHQGLCPIHPEEKRPSFTIYDSGVWICWHEQKMGHDGISLYAAVKGITAHEAKEKLDEIL